MLLKEVPVLIVGTLGVVNSIFAAMERNCGPVHLLRYNIDLWILSSA